MQLFITDFQIRNKEIIIDNPEILSQARKVLRLQKGDAICVQNDEMRYELEISDWNDKQMICEISKEIPKTKNLEAKTGMFVAMPNKWDKIELIAQKLTEIGLDEIVFWPSERSIIKQWNPKKEQRLMKIIREAVEQSRGWKMPNVRFSPNIKDELKDKAVIVFDKRSQMADGRKQSSADGVLSSKFGLVGPEGGLTTCDYEKLEGIEYQVRELGETILRAETAAIVGGWIIKNFSNASL